MSDRFPFEATPHPLYHISIITLIFGDNDEQRRILSSASVNIPQSLCKCIQMHSQPSRPSSLLGGCGGGCSVLSSPVAGWKTRSTVGEAYCEVDPCQRAWETPIKPYVYIGVVIYKCAFSCLKACAPPMPFCFFIRRTADSNRIARTGSLLRVEGEGNKREIEKCACVHFYLIRCSSLELGILLILRYFLSMLTQLCTPSDCVRLCSLTPVHL